MRVDDDLASFEHAEADLESEHEQLVRYHTGKLVKTIRWVLEDWNDTPDKECGLYTAGTRA